MVQGEKQFTFIPDGDGTWYRQPANPARSCPSASANSVASLHPRITAAPCERNSLAMAESQLDMTSETVAWSSGRKRSAIAWETTCPMQWRSNAFLPAIRHALAIPRESLSQAMANRQQ